MFYRQPNYQIMHNNIFKLKFESNFILIEWLDEEDWIKSMYTEYITYIFSMTWVSCL